MPVGARDDARVQQQHGRFPGVGKGLNVLVFCTPAAPAARTES